MSTCPAQITYSIFRLSFWWWLSLILRFVRIFLHRSKVLFEFKWFELSSIWYKLIPSWTFKGTLYLQTTCLSCLFYQFLRFQIILFLISCQLLNFPLLILQLILPILKILELFLSFHSILVQLILFISRELGFLLVYRSHQLTECFISGLLLIQTHCCSWV